MRYEAATKFNCAQFCDWRCGMSRRVSYLNRSKRRGKFENDQVIDGSHHIIDNVECKSETSDAASVLTHLPSVVFRVQRDGGAERSNVLFHPSPNHSEIPYGQKRGRASRHR